MSDVSELVGRLRGPIKHTQQSVSLRLEAADALETLAGEVARLSAIVSGNFENTRLLNAGPSGGGFGFDLTGGPIPYLAEYLAQMLGKGEDREPSNYCEIEIIHHDFGPMTLTLQRRFGKTPHQLRADAESRLAKLAPVVEAARDWARSMKALGNGLSIERMERSDSRLLDALATLEAAHD